MTSDLSLLAVELASGPRVRLTLTLHWKEACI